MKKILTYVICTVVGLVIGAGSYWIVDNLIVKGEDGIEEQRKGSIIESEEMVGRGNWELIERAYTAAVYIRSGDYKSLSGMVHPEYGLLISPYSTVNLTSNQCFSSSAVAGLGVDERLYVWGVTNGSGEPIELAAIEYFERYVYEYDFLEAPIIGVNEIIRTGNTLENVEEVFPEAEFIDFYNPGEADYNWSILRMVFEEYEGRLMLTALIHSGYTV